MTRRGALPLPSGRLAPALALPARAAALALLAVAAPAALAAEADPFAWSGRGAAEGGARWVGKPPALPPRRVITLAPSLTDVVLALGHREQLVGVTRLDDDRAVASLPRVGGFLDPNPEVVLGLRPDLVLWVTDRGALPAVRRLAELAAASQHPFPILAIPVVSVADLYAETRLVGEALGDRPGGERLAAALEASVAGIRARARSLAPKRVLFMVGRDPLVVAGPGSFPDELLRIAGAANVVGGGRPWPVYPLERAVGDDPDLVVDAAMLEAPAGLQRLSAIPAVRRGAVVRPADDGLLRPGPRMIAALEDLLLAIHPEARR